MSAQPTTFDNLHAQLYSRQYLEGIAQFNAGRYYEAHETWEAIWLRSAGEARLFYHALIQVAVALYHHERDNPHGTRALYERACEKLQKLPARLMSLDVREFERQFKTFFAASGESPRPLIRLN